MMTVQEFEAMATPHQSFLFSLAYAKTKDRPAAEDLVQQTFLRAFVARDRFVGADMRNWLCRILTNEFIDVLRKQRHYPSMSFDELMLDTSDRIDELPSRVVAQYVAISKVNHSTDDVEMKAEQRRMLALVVEQVNQMPLTHRQVFYLQFCYPVHSQKMLAEMVHGTEEMVYSRLHRIRRLLQRAMQEQGYVNE